MDCSFRGSTCQPKLHYRKRLLIRSAPGTTELWSDGSYFGGFAAPWYTDIKLLSQLNVRIPEAEIACGCQRASRDIRFSSHQLSFAAQETIIL